MAKDTHALPVISYHVGVTKNGNWDEDEYAATIANAICNKDSVEVFRNTFKDR